VWSAGLLEVVRHLTMLQIDPVAAIAPSAELVAWSRLGSAYSPAALRTALYRGSRRAGPTTAASPCCWSSWCRAARSPSRDAAGLPAAKRRWGYFALPILYGDRLVGKLDARADRRGGVLTVHAIHQDLPFSKGVTADVGHEIGDLARWLGLELVLPA
jgi:uncharacterized protein YcaQ